MLGSPVVPETLVVEDQTTRDIIRQILSKHMACAGDYDRIAGLFACSDILDTCKLLYNFCRENIDYFEESGDRQYASAPATILRRGHADCKGYALFCAGVLDALKRQGKPIDWCYRFANDRFWTKRPGHVFVVVKTHPGEIWIDPVLSEFDYHKFYFNWEDKKPAASRAASIGAVCSCNQVGATGQEVGQLISKTAPALAVIGPVGVFAAAALEVVGLFLQIWGSKYTSSTGVRWLEQMYDYYVRGLGGVTSDNKVPGTTQDIQAAQTWFYAVTGVPIYDKYRWHALRGENGDTGASLNISNGQAASNYLAYPEVKAAGVTYQQALNAVLIAKQMEYRPGDPPGMWANLPVAPDLVDALNAATEAEIAAQSSPSNQAIALPGAAATFAGIPAIPLLIGAAVVFLLLTSKN